MKTKIIKLLSFLLLTLLVVLSTSCKKQPTASFQVSKSVVAVGETVIFTNTSLEGYEFNWNFGDGNSSELEHPEHQYSAEGNYCVMLTVYSKKSKKWDKAHKLITVTDSSSGVTIKHGYLYNWWTVNDSRKISSIDTWRVPSESDLNVLAASCGGSFSSGFGGQTSGGGKLKSTSLDWWNSPNTEATNEFNFDARGGGYRNLDGSFLKMKESFLMWASNKGSDNRAWDIALYYNQSIIEKGRNFEQFGFSIRLMRNATSAEQQLANGAYCDSYVGNDGKSYKTVKIGSQIWLAENLAETQFRNGDEIPVVTDAATWASLFTAARCSYNNQISNAY